MPLFLLNDAYNKSTTTLHAICSRSQGAVRFSCTATEKVNLLSVIFWSILSAQIWDFFFRKETVRIWSSIGGMDKQKLVELARDVPFLSDQIDKKYQNRCPKPKCLDVLEDKLNFTVITEIITLTWSKNYYQSVKIGPIHHQTLTPYNDHITYKKQAEKKKSFCRYVWTDMSDLKQPYVWRMYV